MLANVLVAFYEEMRCLKPASKSVKYSIYGELVSWDHSLNQIQEWSRLCHGGPWSRLENLNREELRDEDIDDNFLDETLMNISSNDEEEIPFDIEINFKKGGKIMSRHRQTHLSRLENLNRKELRDEDIDDNFLDETLMNISSNDEEEIP
ncbi:hypothetical protein Tco_1334307 [Tanacetum coccineum]